MSIALMLREGTAEKHHETETVPYLRAIFRGGLDPQTYTYQLESLKYVYEVMENLFEINKNDPILSKVYYSELNRLESLNEDITFFQKKFNTSLRGKISNATAKYIQYIESVASSRPAMLVAQSYVRYLGDLSGGQAIKKVLVKSFGLEGNDGTAFYEFPKISNLNEFKGIYRQALDTLPFDELQKKELLEEARTTFDLNKFLFLELDDDLRKNIGEEKYQSLFSAR